MSDRRDFYKSVSVLLPYNKPIPFYVYGKYFRILSNSLNIDPLVSFNDQAAESIPAGIGIDLTEDKEDKGNALTKIEITNPSTTSMTLRFVVSIGRIDDNRVFYDPYMASILSEISIIRQDLERITFPNEWGSGQVDDQPTILLDDEKKRFSFFIQNSPLSGSILYIGYNSNVSENMCVVALEKGETFYREKYVGEVFICASAHSTAIYNYDEMIIQ